MSAGEVTFPRVLRAEAIKVLSLRSTFWCSIIIVVLAVGFAALQSVGFAALHGDRRLGAGLVGFDWNAALLDSAASGSLLFGLVAAVLGVLMISGEFGSGMIRSTFAAVPTRIPVLGAKAVVVGALVVATSLVGTVLAALLAAAILGGAGVAADLGAGRLWLGILGAGLSTALLAVFALGIGSVIRNSAGGIATALGVILVLPIVVGGIASAARIDWLQNVGGFLPSQAGSRLSAFGAFGADVTSSAGVVTLNAWAGGGVLLAWVVGMLALGAVLVRRRDV